MKNNLYFFLSAMHLFILITGSGYKAFSQGNGQQGPFYQFGGNNSSVNMQRLGLKTNSDLSIITADTARMDITKEGDVKIKKDLFLEKFPGQQNEKRLIEITPGGRLQPLTNASEALRSFIYAEPGPSPLCHVSPFWAYKPDVMYLVESCNGGRVGIGTENPVQKLDVVGGNVYFEGALGLGTTQPEQMIDVRGNGYFSGNLGIGTITAASKLVIKGGTTNTTSSLNIINSSNQSMLFVQDDGNLGIGTANPGNNILTVRRDQPGYTYIASDNAYTTPR